MRVIEFVDRSSRATFDESLGERACSEPLWSLSTEKRRVTAARTDDGPGHLRLSASSWQQNVGEKQVRLIPRRGRFDSQGIRTARHFAFPTPTPVSRESQRPQLSWFAGVHTSSFSSSPSSQRTPAAVIPVRLYPRRRQRSQTHTPEDSATSSSLDPTAVRLRREIFRCRRRRRPLPRLHRSCSGGRVLVRNPACRKSLVYGSRLPHTPRLGSYLSSQGRHHRGQRRRPRLRQAKLFLERCDASPRPSLMGRV